MSLFIPKVVQVLRIRTTCKQVEQFITKIIEDTIDLREGKKLYIMILCNNQKCNYEILDLSMKMAIGLQLLLIV